MSELLPKHGGLQYFDLSVWYMWSFPTVIYKFYFYNSEFFFQMYFYVEPHLEWKTESAIKAGKDTQVAPC